MSRTIKNNEDAEAVREYIDYYNNERIQEKTKWMPPVKYREASIVQLKFQCVQDSGHILESWGLFIGGKRAEF